MKQDGDTSGTEVSDSEMLKWLISKMELGLGGYKGPDILKNATESRWFLRTEALFLGKNKKPRGIKRLIREAMLRERNMMVEALTSLIGKRVSVVLKSETLALRVNGHLDRLEDLGWIVANSSGSVSFSTERVDKIESAFGALIVLAASPPHLGRE